MIFTFIFHLKSQATKKENLLLLSHIMKHVSIIIFIKFILLFCMLYYNIPYALLCMLQIYIN